MAAVVRRRYRLTFCVLVLLLATATTGCTPGAATSTGDLGSATGTPIEVAEPSAEVPAIDNVSDPGPIIAPTPTPEGPRPLVVATLLGETGVMAPLDGPALAGVAAEVDRLNDGGGVLDRRIQLLRFDTNSRVSLAERTARRVLETPPDLLIVSCDVEFAAPVLQLADEAGVITISPCADDAGYLTGAWGDRNFTMGAPEESRGPIAAKAALERYGSTAMVLRDVTSPEAAQFCDGFERGFSDLGGTVVHRDEFSYDTLEPVQERLQERGRQSDFIVLCSHVPGGVDAAPSIITMVRSVGFQAPIVAGSTLDQPGWFSAVPFLGELLFVSWSSAYGNDPDDRINEIVRRASQEPDTPGPGVSTILGAEAINAWVRAVEAARTVDAGPVGSALASFANEQFSTGAVSFTGGARMDIGRTYRILNVVDGQLTVAALDQSPD